MITKTMLPSTNFNQKPKNKRLVYLFCKIVDFFNQFFKKEGKELPAITAKSASKFYVSFIP